LIFVILDFFIIGGKQTLGLFESSNAEVKALRGLHLYHFALSNCSQRVRMALEEKGLAWTSHPVDLPGGEHATDWYQSINPNGVVPTLVHDGQVIIESNDIIQYLEEHFPAPPLAPSGLRERSRMAGWIEAAAAIQPSHKVISHERLFRPFRQMSAEEVREFAERHRSAELVGFVRDYAENGEAWRARVSSAEREMERALERLEAALGEHPWLSGSHFGLADIAWVVNSHRLLQARYDLSKWPRILDWHQRVAARPSFDRAVTSYREAP
jgi:glutathione S-transferase